VVAVALPASFQEALDGGLAALGIEVDARGRELLGAYTERLLRWNAKVNLTSITAPEAIAEKHLVDSLALLRTLGGARTVLDVGSGAGLPGIALACARRDLDVFCCDSVGKKVAFVKTVSAELDLPVRARAMRAAGAPGTEGLPRADAVVSRAFADPTRWLPLGRAYLAPAGRLFAMLGRDADEAALRATADRHGLVLDALDRFALPRSGAERAIARFREG
jgi:16S rRNA (guanine527-N7)-methyltransferase